MLIPTLISAVEVLVEVTWIVPPPSMGISCVLPLVIAWPIPLILNSILIVPAIGNQTTIQRRRMPMLPERQHRANIAAFIMCILITTNLTPPVLFS